MGEGGYLVNGHRVVAISPGALSLTKKVVGQGQLNPLPEEEPMTASEEDGLGGGLLTPDLPELDANTIPAKSAEFD